MATTARKLLIYFFASPIERIHMDAYIEVLKSLAQIAWLMVAVGTGFVILIGGTLLLIFVIADFFGWIN